MRFPILVSVSDSVVETKEGSTYSSKLLQRPHEVTTPLLQRSSYIIFSHNLLAHLVALSIQRLMNRSIHVVLR